MKAKRFRNEKPLRINWKEGLGNLDFESFPLVGDLVIVPILGEIPGWSSPPPHIVGASFQSETWGHLAGYQWWESLFDLNRQHKYSTPKVPCGSLQEPHEDFQPAWKIVIFEHQDNVYILQADDSDTNDFAVWFRVKAQDYSRAWKQAIEHINQRLGFEQFKVK